MQHMRDIAETYSVNACSKKHIMQSVRDSVRSMPRIDRMFYLINNLILSNVRPSINQESINPLWDQCTTYNVQGCSATSSTQRFVVESRTACDATREPIQAQVGEELIHCESVGQVAVTVTPAVKLFEDPVVIVVVIVIVVVVVVVVAFTSFNQTLGRVRYFSRKSLKRITRARR
jgi:hypothetical protein